MEVSPPPAPSQELDLVSELLSDSDRVGLGPSTRRGIGDLIRNADVERAFNLAFVAKLLSGYNHWFRGDPVIVSRGVMKVRIVYKAY
jgi:hypothetical protein